MKKNKTIIVSNMIRMMKKYCWHIFAFAFLLGVIFLTWLLFFYAPLVTDNEKRLAGIFALLGLGFAIFQFWINEINIRNRKLFDLKYNTYKEFIILFDSISESLNNEMTGNGPIAIHGLVSNLMNQINRFLSTINMHKDYLFPKLHLLPETEEVVDFLNKILVGTDTYRSKIENANKKDNEFAKEFTELIELMNWHNEIREILKDLHEKKYDFYKVLRSYF